MRGLLKLLGLIFLVCVGISIGRRSSEFNPPAAAPILDPTPAETWNVDPPPIAFPSSAFSGPSQIQTQRQTVNVYPSYSAPYDYNWMLTSPSYSLMIRNLGTQRPPPIRRRH